MRVVIFFFTPLSLVIPMFLYLLSFLLIGCTFLGIRFIYYRIYSHVCDTKVNMPGNKRTPNPTLQLYTSFYNVFQCSFENVHYPHK